MAESAFDALEEDSVFDNEKEVTSCSRLLATLAISQLLPTLIGMTCECGDYAPVASSSALTRAFDLSSRPKRLVKMEYKISCGSCSPGSSRRRG